MDKIEKIRQEIERLKGICIAQIKASPGQTFPFVMEMTGYDKLLSFLDTLSEEPEERGNLQDAEVIFCGHALHTDVTKWADGYKLKIRIYDDD